MKNTLLILVVLTLFACNQKHNNSAVNNSENIFQQKEAIGAMLDSFNIAAANADYNRYFNFYTNDAVFIGTDAKENWRIDSFKVWAKPFFDKKKTWNFKSLKRNIFFGQHADIAWFDELLETQMKICRGSGVVVKVGNDWKVQHYVLSMTFPNEQIDAVLPLKAPIEDSLISTLK